MRALYYLPALRRALPSFRCSCRQPHQLMLPSWRPSRGGNKLDNQDESFRPTRGADGRLAPVLTLPGDTLETNNLMIGITAASTLLAIGVARHGPFC